MGAGSSVPSGAPAGWKLRDMVVSEFKLEGVEGLSLSNVATLVEIDYGRQKLIEYIRKLVTPLSPTGGILNIPLFGWSDIFTTNYDRLIEKSFEKADIRYSLVTSNFDFPKVDTAGVVNLFKIHGTIERDLSDGDRSRIIISDADYEEINEFRENLYGRMLNATSRSDVMIIGHSLEDRDLNDIIDKAISVKRKSGAPGKIYVLVYEENLARAKILERRGLEVCFSSLDAYVDAQTKQLPLETKAAAENGNPADLSPDLRATTTDISHFYNTEYADAGRLFYGSPATYGDIAADLTFGREAVARIASSFTEGKKSVGIVLGPAGFGKSTICRMVLARMLLGGANCWEHNSDTSLNSEAWINLIQANKKSHKISILFVDNCHKHLRNLDLIVDHIRSNQISNFQIIIATTKNKWRPRTKSPSFSIIGQIFEINTLNEAEIGNLLNLLDRKPPILHLVDQQFRGYSKAERARRLREKCGSDMFVCLKNMFSVDSLDDIILTDFADLPERLQTVYRTVSALEAFGVRVHRQTVIKLTGIEAGYIENILKDLSGLVSEYDINMKLGIYGWNCRHIVISDIILKYKYSSQDDMYALMESFIGSINPSYDIERININELCDRERGIGRIFDRNRQNILLRQMISAAPSQKVPRHRLIRNLIKDNEFVPAGNEIRSYRDDFSYDAPIRRYDALLYLERAKNSKGLMNEDRKSIAEKAIAILDSAIEKFPWDKNLYVTLCEAGFYVLKITGSWEILDDAVVRFKSAEQEYADPEFGRSIAHIELRMNSAESLAK